MHSSSTIVARWIHLRRTDSFDTIRKAKEQWAKNKDDSDGEVDLLREVLVVENDRFRLYHNSWCEQYLSNINKYDTNGFTLPYIKAVLLAENKEDGHRSYIAYTMDGKPYMEWNDSWDFEFRCTLLRMRVKDECDIRNLAKKVKDGKKDDGQGNV